jgi:uroporphyrinogen-III synthase
VALSLIHVFKGTALVALLRRMLRATTHATTHNMTAATIGTTTAKTAMTIDITNSEVATTKLPNPPVANEDAPRASTVVL